MVERGLWDGHRVLIVAPYGRDAQSLARLLSERRYDPHCHDTLAEAARAYDDGVGAILLTDEALAGDLGPLARVLDAQRSWSDVPFVVLASKRTGADGVRRRLPDAAMNVIVLERPLGSESLVSAIATALRLRQKQFEMRDRLAELYATREALQGSERELRVIADSLPVLIGFVDRDRIYRFANRAYGEWLGVAVEEVIGRHMADLAGAPGYDLRRPYVDRALGGVESRFELSWPWPDGSRRDADVRYIPRFDEAGSVDGFHVFVADITERKHAAEILEQRVVARTRELEAESASRAQAEAALRQSQKMESLGQLTGGIAHDFNNMLTGVIGGLDIVKRRIAAGRLDDVDRFIEAASTSAQRAAALTARLLAFSRRQSLDAKSINLLDLIASLGDLLRSTLGEQIAIHVAHDGPIPYAVADANQLENAILNLCINARDAMPNGGALTIETGTVDLDRTYSDHHPEVAPGRYVVVAVSDTGVGMAPDVLDKVYEPFFTTKPIGQGTGLGLSMVYGFAQQSGGQVRIHSREGAGTTVKIFLPAAEGATAEERQPAPAVPAGRGQNVLLVEDDASVRLLVRDLLDELGYHAVEVPEAGAAIDILSSDASLDLMISDVGLPGMNGRQLAEIARQHRPDLPILFITGYAENAAIRAGFLGTNMSMVTKPFAVDALARKIDELLAGAPVADPA
ncbi:ATP-binding protein [Sphingomonas sp. HF-S3]|uniref:histidine kinase n=1 Tax=Sphingomonas rustica TaxID=3103142 RepID=A0ABV0BC40_9SPHN